MTSKAQTWTNPESKSMASVGFSAESMLIVDKHNLDAAASPRYGVDSVFYGATFVGVNWFDRRVTGEIPDGHLKALIAYPNGSSGTVSADQIGKAILYSLTGKGKQWHHQPLIRTQLIAPC